MLVTLYSDASYCHTTKAVGIAYWLKSEMGRFVGQGSGILPQVNHAEMAAVFMGISKALAIWDSTTAFCVNSDNLYVVNALNCKAFKAADSINGRKINEIFIEIEKMKKHSNLKIYAKHVKAHTGGVDTRSYINRQVDKLSRKAMKEKRAKIIAGL